ncbi:hypothetical protein ACFVYA_39820 [Amycolatopsis sp. NPDC058278]|uniref:hypothetical protein n=1 Tax=Amycolatopsis sp. NPDC058278 TaxID=3346417 RepID=UPI0036DD1857
MTIDRTTRTTRPARRIGLTRFLGNLIDDTKDFVDDVLDRGDEVEHDLRNTARRTLREDDRDEDPREDQEELAALREQLNELAEKVSLLSAAGGRAEAARTS